MLIVKIIAKKHNVQRARTAFIFMLIFMFS